MSAASDYLGRFHPLLVHFPIALVLTGAAAECARCWRDSAFLARATVWLLGLGAVAALVTSGSGWLLAGTVRRSDVQTLLAWHRWLGLAAAVLAGLAWVAAVRWAEAANNWRWARRGAVFSAAIAVAFAAHLGALLVWGRDWFDLNLGEHHH